MSYYCHDVVDANTIAWDTFTASLDLAQLELERITRSAVSAEVAAHDLAGERFGSRRHREMVWRHEVVRVRSKQLLAAQPLPLGFTALQARMVVEARMVRNGFAKGLTGDVTASSDSGAHQPTIASETHREETAA